MLEAVIIGPGRSTPGLFSSRRRILRWRRFNWRRTLAFTRKPPGGERARVVKHLNCSRKPGGFRVPRPQHASNYAWLRARVTSVGNHWSIENRLHWQLDVTFQEDQCRIR